MKSVLLVDGSNLFTGFLRDKFSAERITLEYANSREAYTRIITQLPDLIIIELKDGLNDDIVHLLEKKHTDPNAKRIPIVLTGPVIEKKKIAELVPYGIKKYFTKPINFESFFESVGDILKVPFSMDSTPCIMDIHLNENIIFVEIAQGLNREKLFLLKYKLSEIIEKYKITVPKVILMLTSLELSFIDGSNLEVLLDNITAEGRVVPKNVKILSLSDFVNELVKGHAKYSGMEVTTNLQSVLGKLLNQQTDYDIEGFISDKVLASDRTIESDIGFSKQNTDESESGTTLKVAVVDDDVVIRKLLENSFSSIGAEVELYEGAVFFFKALGEKKHYDIIILDLFLPDMDGLTVLRNLQRQGLVTPILVYSRATEREYVIQALSLGAKSYLVKPQKPGVVVNKALEILHASK